MGLAAVICGHDLGPWNITRAETAWRLDVRLETQANLLGLGPGLLFVRPPLAFPAGSFDSDCVARRRARKTRVFVLVVLIFLVVCFLIFRLFPTKFALDFVDVHPDTVLSLGALALFGNLGYRQPAVQGEVDRLGAVVTQIVSGVVAVRIRDDKFAGVRHAFVDRDVVVLLQVRG